MKILVKRDSSNYIAAATDKKYTPEQIEFIIEHGSDDALCDLINRTQDEDIMTSALNYGCSPSVRWYIAHYTNNADNIHKLVRDRSKSVKSKICERIESNRFDPNIIETLANDSNYKIREMVAENTTDCKILMQLAQDSRRDVRWYVAWNDNIVNDIDIIELLAQDNYSNIRRKVARFIRNYPELLDIFLADSNDDVVSSAFYYASDEAKRQYLDVANRSARYEIARSTEDPEILDILSHESDEAIRRAVAENEYASVDTLNYMALYNSADSHFVLSEVLNTQKVSEDVVWELAKSNDRGVRRSVAYWCEDSKYRDILEMLAEDSDEDVREEARRNLR